MEYQVGTLAKILFVLWLCALPILTAIRVQDWRSDLTLWTAASRVPPVSRRAWSNLTRWDMIILDDERDRPRQPFSWHRRPR